LALEFVNPEEEDNKHDAEVEEIRRDPEEIDPCHRSKEEGKKVGKGGRRGIGEREVGKAHEQDEKKEQRVKNQEAVISENSDKRSSKKRISPGFGVEDFIVLGFFQEDALRTRHEIVIVADQVFFCIFQVSVVGDTLGQSKINSLVRKEEIIMDCREVDKKGEAQEKEKDQKDDAES
jgi:hypothetical protein